MEQISVHLLEYHIFFCILCILVVTLALAKIYGDQTHCFSNSVHHNYLYYWYWPGTQLENTSLYIPHMCKNSALLWSV